MNTIEQLIQEKAYSLGYEKCGIVPLKELQGYGERFEERIRKLPASGQIYDRQRRLVNPLESYPWARSVVVLVNRYGKYKIPEPLKNRIARYYLVDHRNDENAQEHKNNRIMEEFMEGLELRIAGDRKFGIVGLRFAAMQAGLGMVRRNNFFYTESGSWVNIEAWLTDRDMRLTEKTEIPPCPKGCNLCIRSCPTGSLCEPFTMLPNTCISYLTTFGGRNLTAKPLRNTFQKCIYGCDICQEVCPMNKGKWEEKEEFPGLEELAPYLTPEMILDMGEEFYKTKIQPKFFYLSPDDLWKWKINVLVYMKNNYEERYKSYILSACSNSHEKIREMAQLLCHELNLTDNCHSDTGEAL